jgi:hypothetical protein
MTQEEEWRKEYNENHDGPFTRWSCYLAGRQAEHERAQFNYAQSEYRIKELLEEIEKLNKQLLRNGLDKQQVELDNITLLSELERRTGYSGPPYDRICNNCGHDA